MCAKALTALLNQAEQSGLITPAPIGRGLILVNHLFFTDDSILFYQATPLEHLNVLKILKIYEKASGQVLNKEKSIIFFSKNTKQDDKHQILKLAGVNSCSKFERYLGLPALVVRRKVVEFHGLIDRTWARVTNWKSKYLSAVGKEVLLKAVLQAIPTYSMGIILLPISITRRLNQLLKNSMGQVETN
ncbi:uncharacterized protein LOC122282236 [Carya illinoinensis]|uniref:uncharacterized protein LOC122282236 n=1 Tax=Carya illinoinensis TaxID=32201 RepID=UPI001C71F106|nr:uncharacterized protein LOC122282236 [Carya illinoinensis]